MNEAVGRLIGILPGKDPEARKEVVLHLALVLELNAMAPDSRKSNRGDYALTLPEELLEVELALEERIEISRVLHDSFLAAPECSEILWAMGKARVPEAVELLLDIIEYRGTDLTEEAYFQALSAVERYAFQRDLDLSGRLKMRLRELVARRNVPNSERVDEVLSFLRDDLRRAEERESAR
jgi:hypothetical protein